MYTIDQAIIILVLLDIAIVCYFLLTDQNQNLKGSSEVRSKKRSVSNSHFFD